MLSPAFGVMMEIYQTKNKKDVPNKFFLFYMVSTILLIILGILLPFISKNKDFYDKLFMYGNMGLIGMSVISLILLLIEKKDVKEKFGLKNRGFKKLISYSLLFLVLFTVTKIIGFILTQNGFLILKSLLNYKSLMLIGILFLNILLSFVIFFGEEYGWRYYMTPIMQEKFGVKKGLIVASLVWGLWHLPLNLFYYSAQGAQIPSFISQLFACLSFGIIFTYGYIKTKNLWVPVMMHYINNNFNLLFLNGSIEGYKNQSITLRDAFIIGIIFLIVYGWPILTKTFKSKEAIIKNHSF